ncbi:MAG: hypothetical protein ACO1NO_10170 [Burkholderiaceae bacterium]
MHTKANPGLRLISTAVLVFILSGCAVRGIHHHTSAYKDCVHAQAVSLLDSNHSPYDSARLASAQCQGNLALINEKLRQENAWIEHYGSNADGHTERIREETVRETAAWIRDVRSGQSSAGPP